MVNTQKKRKERTKLRRQKFDVPLALAENCLWNDFQPTSAFSSFRIIWFRCCCCCCWHKEKYWLCHQQSLFFLVHAVTVEWTLRKYRQIEGLFFSLCAKQRNCFQLRVTRTATVNYFRLLFIEQGRKHEHMMPAIRYAVVSLFSFR